MELKHRLFVERGRSSPDDYRLRTTSGHSCMTILNLPFRTEFSVQPWPLQTLFASKSVAEKIFEDQGTTVNDAYLEAEKDSFLALQMVLTI